MAECSPEVGISLEGWHSVAGLVCISCWVLVPGRGMGSWPVTFCIHPCLSTRISCMTIGPLLM